MRNDEAGPKAGPDDDNHDGTRIPAPASTVADLSARLLRARRHAVGLQAYLDAVGHRAEASAARTLLDLLDGRWAR